MTHHFILEFERVGGASPHLEGQVTRIADTFHSDPTVIDVSVGADLAAGRVEFEVGADAVDMTSALGVERRDRCHPVNWGASDRGAVPA